MANWKQLFSFTKQERNGIIVLSVLIIGAFGYLVAQPFLFRGDPVNVEIPQEFLNAMDSNAATVIEPVSEKENDEPDLAAVAGTHSVYQQNELFLFNPNGLSEADWIRLGLSPKQAQSVKNFEAKGGVFRSKEDVKKLYVISPEKYLELEPFIVIPMVADSLKPAEKKSVNVIIELNTADTSQLVKVNGIGPVFAARIVAYRLKLGGFHHKEQLMEVFGIDEQKYNTIQGSFKIDTTYITKINVNTAEVSDLKKHPYVTPTVANALVAYRKSHGMFKQLSDIRQCKVITEELYVKLSPYLTI